MKTQVEVLHDFPDVFSCSQVVWSDEFLGCSTQLVVHKLVVKFLNTCHIFISCIVVVTKVTHKVQLHLDWYVWMNRYLTPYIHVAYIVSHAIECHVQLVLNNYTNL
jgi:hypothetical protein